MKAIWTSYVLRGLALAAIFSIIDGAVGFLPVVEADPIPTNCSDDGGCNDSGFDASCSPIPTTGRCNCKEKPRLDEEGPPSFYYCHYTP